MPITSPMFHTGATTKAMPTITITPGCEMPIETLQTNPALEGMNAMFVLDVLSDMAAHDRCSRHLYLSLAGRSSNPMLQRQYASYAQDAEKNIGVTEQLIVDLGGDPGYVSPSARATEKMNGNLLEATFMLEGSVDIMTQELVMLDAVLLAATRADAAWSGLATLAPAFPEGAARDAVQRAVDQVDPADALDWARSTRTKLIGLQAKSTMATTIAATAEDLMARVKTWFD